MYLNGDAKLWWHTRMANDLSAGLPIIMMWESLKKDLKDQFLPCNTSWLAKENLKKLKQTKSMTDYVIQFLDIRHSKHVRRGQTDEFNVWSVNMGTNRVKKARCEGYTFGYSCY
ncbi:hypothetical protein LWI28_000181 [Acer negundo]|uniref:Retrotransposon gag domain-containing protein n=1 Tax=Acer negundo TaxID=4023 RepID=A0AAD5INH4_ACENE|nr:hypothetical protein LWI28_000181 [Acer negundo]